MGVSIAVELKGHIGHIKANMPSKLKKIKEANLP